MTSEQARKLLGGYATNSLTEAERKALFDAALDDQELPIRHHEIRFNRRWPRRRSPVPFERGFLIQSFGADWQAPWRPRP